MYSQLNDDIFIYLGKPYDRRNINYIYWQGRQDYSGFCKAKLWTIIAFPNLLRYSNNSE